LANGDAPLSLAHPKMLEALRDQKRGKHQAPPSLRSLLRAFPGAARRAVGSRTRSR
jgi:hypothetical protein